MRLLLIFITIGFLSLSQEGELLQNKTLHFKITTELDTIDFLIVDTLLTEKKPVFLYCQGSLPIPLFIDFGHKDIFFHGGGISNFDVNKIKEKYHLVVISMPDTPLIVNSANLNKRYSYVTDSTNQHSYKESYLRADYLENYARRAKNVLSFLHSKIWVDNSQLVVTGHSQGAKVAVKIAAGDKNVTQLGLFGFNPFGRIEQMIRQERKYAEEGQKTWEEAETRIAYWEQLWRDANNPDSVKTNPNLVAWKSFSQPSIHDLLKINIPTYVCYGTEDLAASHCDLLPLLYLSAKNNNLTLVRKYALQHNFFELRENNRADFNKPHWNEVMNEFVEWTKE